MTKDQIAVLNKALDTNKPVDLIDLSDTLISIDEQLDGGFDPSDSEALLLVAHMLRNKALEQERLLDKIEKEKKWLFDAGNSYYNIDIAFDSIKHSIKRMTEDPGKDEFMNKQCVSSGVCEHDKMQVLDKIRAEINSLHNGCGLFNDGVDESLKIIDKYRNGEQK